ncbi:GSCOCG00004466001-RA-CDS [Cotesia congregata]|uniref:Similar to CG18335: UPF0605 protein CG18335 (Drosophila melanogaster) n=1 Tax=Cotesia congregata TaxID=51543 RepID=A0A8J2HGT3_COTCN|nr:GSCOCG00004466001-RA-CDS [Cotesia congregata]CAG5095316.1 Similar to CG18335: UPF0605 protein CG18335 (Drosophila melanogaster) [Cotesia congregata]
MATVELLNTPQPHLIPGYTGCCPQYRYRCGETYGSLTHKLLVDPTINRSERLILSNRVKDDYEVLRPPKDDIDIVNARSKRRDVIYTHPMIPGYQGFMPNLNARLGHRYSVIASEGLADFERQQMKSRAALNHLRKVRALHDGYGEPRSLDDRQLLRSEYKMPLVTVRPDYAMMMRNLPVDEAYQVPRDHSPSPFFMENSDPDKYFVSGYSGHIPYGYSHFGSSHVPMTNSALCDFTTNYRMRQSTEWAPATISRPDPPYHIHPAEIYHKHVGLIPNYLGHVPGAAYRYGKTFGADTKDAKRWLRGDFSI